MTIEAIKSQLTSTYLVYVTFMAILNISALKPYYLEIQSKGIMSHIDGVKHKKVLLVLNSYLNTNHTQLPKEITYNDYILM